MKNDPFNPFGISEEQKRTSAAVDKCWQCGVAWPPGRITTFAPCPDCTRSNSDAWMEAQLSKHPAPSLVYPRPVNPVQTIDLALEGEALSHILGTLQQLSQVSRDRVLQAVIELAAPAPIARHPSDVMADEFAHSGFQNSNVAMNLQALRDEQGEGDEEGP